MGVRHLLTFCKDSATEVPMTSLMGLSMAIDGMQQIVKYCISFRKSGSDLYNGKGKSVTHLYATLRSLSTFLSLAILPIYVFDGKVPDNKKVCTKIRKEKKQEAKEKCKEISDKTSNEYIKNFKRAYSLSRGNTKEIETLLQYCGIPFMRSPYEADPQCAILSYQNDIYSVISDDSDIIVYGANSMLRDFSIKNSSIKEYTHSQIIDFLNKKKISIIKEVFGDNEEYNNIGEFKHENLVDIAVLFGSEYCTKNIKGISYNDLFKLYVINKMNIERTLNCLINYSKNKSGYVNSSDINYILLNHSKHIDVPDEFINSWKKAKEYYLNAKVIPPSKVDYKFNKPNRQMLLKLLCEENDFDLVEISKFISQLEDLYTLWSNNSNRDSKFYTNLKRYQMNYINMKKSKYTFSKYNSCSSYDLDDNSEINNYGTTVC
jgi:flap endonuclease-1